jgi:hypothetical protein
MRCRIHYRSHDQMHKQGDLAMTTLSITSIKTMTYDANAVTHGFAILEKLASVTGALLQTARGLRVSVVAAPRAAQA